MMLDREMLIKDIEKQMSEPTNEYVVLWFSEAERVLALLKEQDTVEHALEVLRKAGWKETQDVPFPAELLKEQAGRRWS